MTDSYTSSRNGDVNSNGGPTNASSPSLVPTTQTGAASSVIRKKLMGYVGFANLPNQVHRKSVRKGFQFTAMVVGQSPFARSQSATCRLPRSCTQASLASESPRSSIPSSTPLCIRPRSRFPPRQSDRRLSPLRASAQVPIFIPYLPPPLADLLPLRVDIEENGVRLHLTVVDTPGFGDFVNNDDR
jgi:septin 7